MSAMASQITSLTIVYSSVYSGVNQRKHQSSASLAFVGGIHRSPVNSPHKWPVTWKMFPFEGGPCVLRRVRWWLDILIYNYEWSTHHEAYMTKQNIAALVQIMTCHLFCARPSSETVLDSLEYISAKFESKYNIHAKWYFCLILHVLKIYWTIFFMTLVSAADMRQWRVLLLSQGWSNVYFIDWFPVN